MLSKGAGRRRMENIEVLRKVDLFQGLQEKEMESLAQVCGNRDYKMGEKIFAEDSEGDELYILKKGKASIELAVRGDAMFTALNIVSEGQILGELALVDRGHRSATAKSMIDCEVIVLPREKLYRLFEENSRIGYVIMKNIATVLAARLRKTNLRLIQSMM